MKKSIKPVKKLNPILDVIIACVLSYIIMEVGSIVGYIPLISAFNSTNGAVITFAMYFVFFGIWVLAIGFCFLFRRNRPVLKAYWTTPKGNTFKMFGVGMLMGFVMNGSCILAAFLHGDIKLFFDSFRPVSFILVFVAVFVQCAAEELVSRGFLFQRVISATRIPLIAIIISSSFFSILHANNPGVTPLALFSIVTVGVLLALMVYYIDSLWAAFGLHTAWNFTQNIIFGLPNSGMVTPYSVIKLDASTASDSFFYNVGFGVESTWFAVIVELAAIAGILYWGIKNNKKPTDVWDGFYTNNTNQEETVNA